MVILCLPMVLIGASSMTWVRLTVTPSASNEATMSRTVTEPNNWPVSEAWRMHDDVAAVDLLGDLGGFALGLEVVGLELGLHAVELGAVVGGGAQRLAALQKKIAGKAVLDADDFAHLAELGDAFQQNDFHVRSPLR